MSFRPCSDSSHVSLVNGLFCLLTTGARPPFQAHMYASRTHRDTSGIIPDGESIDSEAWNAQADSPLFKLPFEVLVMIIEFLPLCTLDDFALTCRACDQFAKWQQFGTTVVSDIVRLGIHDDSLLSRLIREVSTTSSNGLLPVSRQREIRLGPSIRRLVLRTNAASFKPHALVDRVKEATNLYSMHLQHIAFVIKHGLPNLKAIRFEDRVPIPQAMWRTLMLSPVRELELFNFHAGDPVEPPMPPEVLAWALTSLSIGDIGLRAARMVVNGGYDLHDPIVESRVICHLIKLSAPTLKSLRLLCCSNLPIHPHRPFRLLNYSPVEDISTSPSFPQLRELQIDLLSTNTEIYSDLLNPALRYRLQALSLGVNYNIPPIDAITNSAVPHYPSLQYFGASLKDDLVFSNGEQRRPTPCSLVVVASLLKANPQLEAVELHMDQRGGQLLKEQIIPMFNVHYGNLTSLSVKMDPGIMDNGLLYALGNLIALQKLRIKVSRWVLTYGPQELRSDHKAVRQILSATKGLRCLAIEGLKNHPATRDNEACLSKRDGALTYNDEEDDTPPPYGYDYDYVPLNEKSPQNAKIINTPVVPQMSALYRRQHQASQRSARQVEEDDAQKQRKHTISMLRHARNYFVRFPRLEWVYFGERLMGAPIGQDRGMRPRVLGPLEGEAGGVTNQAVQGFMDTVFGWKGFSVRGFEQWGGVRIDLEGAILGHK